MLHCVTRFATLCAAAVLHCLLYESPMIRAGVRLNGRTRRAGWWLNRCLAQQDHLLQSKLKLQSRRRDEQRQHKRRHWTINTKQKVSAFFGQTEKEDMGYKLKTHIFVSAFHAPVLTLESSRREAGEKLAM